MNKDEKYASQAVSMAHLLLKLKSCEVLNPLDGSPTWLMEACCAYVEARNVFEPEFVDFIIKRSPTIEFVRKLAKNDDVKLSRLALAAGAFGKDVIDSIKVLEGVCIDGSDVRNNVKK